MQKTILTIVMATLCLFFKANGQFYKPSNKTIRIGEILPDSFYQIVHQAVNVEEGIPTTIQLQQYRNKLIILDFWATWCKPCIYSLNKLDSIQKVTKTKDFVVIPVTYQSMKESSILLNKVKWDMKTIVSDTVLSQIFPHEGLPHQIWIRDGKVIAIPLWKYATAENITKAVKGEKTNLLMNIQDKKIEVDKPLQLSVDQEAGQIFFQSLVSREIPGAMKSPLVCRQTPSATVFTMINQTVKDLLFETYKRNISAELIANNDKGIIWEISDSLQKSLKEPKHLLYVDFEKDEALKIWQRNNLYCYQLFSTAQLDSNEAYGIMQRDVSKYLSSKFNLQIEMGNRIQKVGILKLLSTREETQNHLRNTGKKWKVEMKTHYSMSDVGFRAILGLIPVISQNALAINRTGIAPQFAIDFDLPKSIDNNPTIANKELAKYGLELVIEEIPVPVLFVKEKGYKSIKTTKSQSTINN